MDNFLVDSASSHFIPNNILLNHIVRIACDAGHIIMSYYNTNDPFTHKSDRTPLTQADLAANEMILKRLEILYPSIPIISEESLLPSYSQRQNWKEFWLVDPLDGTSEFIEKLDEFTVNIALIQNGKPTAGVVYAPARELLYYASVGLGAWRAIKGAEPSRIFSALPDFTRAVRVVESRRHGTAELDTFLREKKLQVSERISAGSSLKFCFVAEGTADIYPRMTPTMEWDVAAGDCIYRNSAPNGERVTSLSYNKPSLKNGPFVIGMN